MRTRFALMLLSLTVVTALAGEPESPDRANADLIAIRKVAEEHKPEGTTSVQMERVAGMDLAYVRYSVCREDHEFATTVLTLRKTSKGWDVESCAR